MVWYNFASDTVKPVIDVITNPNNHFADGTYFTEQANMFLRAEYDALFAKLYPYPKHCPNVSVRFTIYNQPNDDVKTYIWISVIVKDLHDATINDTLTGAGVAIGYDDSINENDITDRIIWMMNKKQKEVLCEK